MTDVPEWLRDVPVPSDEEFEVMDQIRGERERENDELVARLCRRPDQ